MVTVIDDPIKVRPSGGAIYMNTTSPLTVTDSSFEDFYASNAGAIFVKAGSITGSTFANNSVTGDGGAVYGTNAGIKYINSTFSANDAGNDGGAIYSVAGCTIKNSTFYNNTATATAEAIRGLTCTVANTIVTKTTASSSLCTGVTSSDYNLQYNGTCFTAQTNDKGTDPLLSVLADNGGPTKTHAINAGSDAIDNGLGSVCMDTDVNSVDQRREARTSTCDIGAFEF
jgi:predicted outer membrane repeat protein